MSKIMREIYAEARRIREAVAPSRERRRYSMEESDSEGYRNWLNAKIAGKVCRVFVNGKPVPGAILADEARGFVVANVMPIAVVDGEVSTHRLHGAVLVELVDFV